MNLSPIVSKTIPEFVNDDYPLFVQFLKTYYKWLDETQITSIEDVVDIDTTLDSFVQYFRKELDVFGIKYQYVDERIYLKHVKQFFLAKGSEAAYWFLFRILFNSDSAILRPWDSVFIPSNAKWVQDITILVRIDKGDGNSFKGNNAIIIGDDKKEYPIRIVDVVSIKYNVVELYVGRLLTGNIKVGNIIISENKAVKGRLLPTITKVNVQYPGQKFNVGEIYDIENNNGYGSKFIIREVNEDGGITKVELISFGLGYENEFMQVIYPLTVEERIEPTTNITISGSTMALTKSFTYKSKLHSILESGTIHNGGYVNSSYFSSSYLDALTVDTTLVPLTTTFNIYEEFQAYKNSATAFLKYNSGDTVSEISDSGDIVKHNYGITPTQYFLDLTYVGSKVGQFSDKITSVQKKDDAAILFCYTGFLAKYPGYYSDLYDVLGQSVYIQDSYYYQIYSYVTSVDKPLKQYKSLINNVIHPSGNKLFGNYIPTNLTNYTLGLNSSLQVIFPDSIWTSPVIVSDESYIDLIHNLSDQTVYAYDGIMSIFNNTATLSENIVRASDEVYQSIGKNFDETIHIGEELSQSRDFNDYLAASDEEFAININIDIGTQEFYTLTDTPIIYNTVNMTFADSVIVYYPADDLDIVSGLIFNERVVATQGDYTKVITLRFNENMYYNEGIQLYYGELYVNQTPIYWDVEYYENERLL